MNSRGAIKGVVHNAQKLLEPLPQVAGWNGLSLESGRIVHETDLMPNHGLYNFYSKVMTSHLGAGQALSASVSPNVVD